MKLQKSISAFFFLFISLFLFYKCKTEILPESRLGLMSIPQNNLQTKDKIDFGRKLFFDKRLSPNNTISCATCHDPQKAFTDGKKLSVGFHGRLAMRNAPTLLNVGYQKTLMFDGEIPSLEMQAVVPLKDSAEMANDMKSLIQKLKSIPEYQEGARKFFQRDFDAFVLTRSLAAFQRSLVSFQTPFDEYRADNDQALSQSQVRGWRIFSEKLYCTECHVPPHFTNFKVANNGLYASYAQILDKGRFRINGDSTEIGSFKVPTLRNILKTAPYMHDGSMNTIEEVISHYEKGGNRHVHQSKIIKAFRLSSMEKTDLVAFLRSLSD
jgi:cytochrome c peroxidase